MVSICHYESPLGGVLLAAGTVLDAAALGSG